MRLIINKPANSKNRVVTIKTIELTSLVFNDNTVTYLVYNDEIPLIKFTDTGEIFNIKTIKKTLDQSTNEAVLIINLSDLELIISNNSEGGGGGGPTTATQVSIEPIDTLTSENVQEALAELTTRAGTGASVPTATQSTPGIVELATALETSTGADGSRAVSPLTLKPLLDAKAPVSHSHTGYASDTHTHTEYAATSHTHSIANVVNLTTALNSKADSSHAHTEYAATGHGHAIANITGLETALSGKADSSHTHTGYAQTDHVHSDYATLNSPTFTGAPTAPTPAASDDSTKIATTAYVQAELSQFTPSSSGTIATQETVNAGVNNTETVTPLTLHTKLNQAVYTNRYNANISVLAADTPVSINHNLNLANKYGFVINLTIRA